MDDQQRARSIVKLAAGRCKSKAAQSWLDWDICGTWERDASEMLAKVPDLMAKTGLIRTPDQVDSEIADVLAIRALRSLLENAKKRKRKD